MGVKLEERVRFFRKTYYKIYKQLYRSLHSGQQPEILFITCGDSRILPHQLLHAIPGELFILRNAGNIVPPYSSGLSEVAG
ncbi:MAG: carbonic anhydrase, partial [Legionella sp.]